MQRTLLRTSLLVLVLLWSCFLQAQHRGDQGITQTQAKEDLLTMVAALETYHPDLYLYTSEEDMAAAVSAIDESLVAGMSVLNFYRAIAPLIPLIGNNHTKLLVPESYIDSILGGAPRFPFSLYVRNDTVFVLEDALTPNHIWEGRILDSIYYRPIGEHIQYFLERIPTDGFNRTLPLVHASKGFSRQWALHYGLPDSFWVTYEDYRGNKGRTWIQAISAAEYAASRAQRRATPAPAKPPFEFKVEKQTAVLTVRTFQPAVAKDFKKFLQSSFARIEADSLTSLILDLRGNLGGYPEASWALLAYLIPEPVHPTKTEYALVDRLPEDHLFLEDAFYKHFRRQRLEERDGKFYVRGVENQVIKPKYPGFRGRLVVMMDASTSSTAGQLLGLLKAYTPAKFVGEESGGNPVTVVADDLLTLVLPHSGLHVRIPVIKSVVNVPFQAAGRGMMPDVPVMPGIEALLQGKDRAMQVALGLAAEDN